ncbi:beta-galactosidase [Actinomadura sp. KC06]|uniref:beta-galactosidase n=1 Tax=Actinomadura sp. KC06 TaxID=2530369 RepID=UPI001A9F06C0|nr:beta-galactosidase [Actinomadura sp. KC06]
MNDRGEGLAAGLRARLGGSIGYGGDYNPEQWPEDVWAEDVRLMAEAGVNLVSLGIFSWARVQPEPETFDWGWLDRVMDLLADGGVAVCLATMTASPPPWLARLHPETLPVRPDGTVLWPGARQHFTPSSRVYRDYATRLVERLATRYGGHPALAAWHVGNEYGCHVSDSYGNVDAVAFRDWLRRRYGTIDALNEAWSTTFWSQRYATWDEINPPRQAPTFPNPAQRIDFRRFSSDALLECFLAEKEVLRRVTPNVPVTTNFFPLRDTLDLHAWAPHQDVVSYDSYPDPADPGAHVAAAFAFDLMRSLKDGAPWLLLEQAPTAVNWRRVNRPKAPGQMRLWSWQAVGRGADAVMFFQWRASRGGAEKYHSAMVPHAGTGTRTFQEVRELGRELAGVPEIAGARVRAPVALVLDWPSWWGLEQDSHPSALLRQREASLAHYAPLFAAGVTCDVVHPSADLSGYRLVAVPNLYMITGSGAANLAGFVRGGGHLLVSFFSGVVDERDRVHPGGAPGPLADVLGLRVAEFWPLAKGEHVDLNETEPGWFDGGAARGSLWSEEVRLDAASPLATFASGAVAGRPAAARNRFGTGTAYYLATRPAPAAMGTMLSRICREAGAAPDLPDVPEGVETVTRHTEDGTRFAFVLNHNDRPVAVPLPPGGVDPRDGTGVIPPYELDARGVLVVRYSA